VLLIKYPAWNGPFKTCATEIAESTTYVAYLKMAGLSMVIKCRLVAIILSVAAVAVTTAGGCYCSLGMTSSSDVIIILATGA